MKNFLLGIPIDDTAKPVIQPVRCVPFHLRDKLEKKLDELKEKNINERAEGSSKWVSTVEVIPKGLNGPDIRL